MGNLAAAMMGTDTPMLDNDIINYDYSPNEPFIG